ncbi:MAG: lycopene beta cyclase [Dactylosporangium sp.]|nr:lycopene beta cyclase [Dactylosporangium sp.]
MDHGPGRRPGRGDAFDVVIVGAGLSGLSLAGHLTAGRRRDLTVLLIDHDRDEAPAGWAYWQRGPGPLDEAVCRAYPRVLVHATGRGLVVPLGGYTYRAVRRADLRRVVAGRLAGRPASGLCRGHVSEIREEGDAATVVVDGVGIGARWVFDSRPGPTGGRPPEAFLAFRGWRVRCARPVFDPDLPTLMDFRTSQAGGVRFGYVLPQTPHLALIEMTAFAWPGERRGPEPPPDPALHAYLTEVLNVGGYEIRRTETGTLGLRLSAGGPMAGAGRIVPIGARAGLVKASTGYAYGRIQRDSARIAHSLATSGHPWPRPASRRRHRLGDALLLDALHADGAAMERVFARLFAGNPAERVLAFLDEDTRLFDELRLIATLPPAPFLRAIVRRSRSRLAG